MTVNRPLFQVLLILKCELFCLVQSQTLQISSKFMSGNVIFTWTPATYPAYDVQFTTDITNNTWTTVYDAQFTVKDALLYDLITINVRRPGPANDNRVTYNVSKVKSQIGDTKNTSWITATLSPVFAFFGQYQVYHTYRKKRTILSVSSSGVRYDGKTTSPKYTLLAGPFDSTNVTFEIRDITMGDAGYYHGGLNDEAAWSGGGVVLIVSGKPLKPNITGNLNVEVNRYITLTCSSNSTSAPDYYSKLVTLSYTWFVNDTKINVETRETLRREVTRDVKYNRYSCTATEDLESEKSDQVQINPLYISDKLSISPQLTLNYDNKLVVKEGDTVGPFKCSADCNPACDITWVLRISGRVMDASAKDGMLLPLVVNRNMELVQCETEWKHNNETVKQGIGLDVQYLENPILYVNDILHSKGDVNENMTLKISCHVDGNPDPTIRLSRGQADTVFLERQGAWLNHTITKAQCTDTDTYTCRGTSTGFNNTETEFNINVFCKTRFDYSRSFEYIYGSKSGVGVKVNAAVPIIANPPPQISDFTWEGPVPVSLRTTILRGATIYTHVIESAVPVKDPNYFGNYTLKYKGQTITKITIKAEDVPQTPLNFMVYSYASGLVNLTWVSGFNGGLQQFFILSVNEGSTWKVIGNVSDPGERKVVHFDPGFCTPGQEYWFRLKSCNKINCSQLSADYKVTVKDTLLKNINLESSEVKSSTTCIVVISLLSIFLGLTWCMVAMFVIYKKRYHNVDQNNKHGDESIQLEAQNMTQQYDNVQGTVGERHNVAAKGDYTDVEGDYTELGHLDPETPYEELNA